MREEYIRQRDGHYKWTEVRKTREKKAVGEEQEGEEGLRNKPHPMASKIRMNL